jgi:hypothetical protein
MTTAGEWPPHTRWELRQAASRLIRRESAADEALDVLAEFPVTTGLVGRLSRRWRIHRTRRHLRRHKAAWQTVLDQCGVAVRRTPDGAAQKALRTILLRTDEKPFTWLTDSSPLDEALLPALHALDAHHPALLESRLRDLLRSSAGTHHTLTG